MCPHGDTSFDVRAHEGYAAPSDETCRAWGADLDFDPDGDVGRAIDPPIRSIPELLRRLPEVRRIVEALPESAPGVLVGTREVVTTVFATGEEKRRRQRIFAFRKPCDW